MTEISSITHDAEQTPRSTKAWFFFIILYLLIDFGRLQDSISFIGKLRPAVFVTIILFFLVLNNRNLIPRKIPQISSIWSFILILALHVPFATNNRIAYDTAYKMLLIIPVLLSFLVCLNNFARFKKILILIICLITYQALIGLTHAGSGGGSMFGDENDMALALNTWLPFCFSMFLSEKRSALKFYFLIFSLLIISAIVLSFSRGGFLGLIAMTIVFWLFSPRKKMTLGIILLGAILIVFITNMISEGRLSHQKKTTFWEEMASATDSSTGTGKERVESWKAGWRMFLAHPLGVGGGNFAIEFPAYQEGGDFYRNMWGRASHSLWFTLLPETGIPGTIVYLILIFHNFKTAMSLRKPADHLSEEETRFYKGLSVAFIASFIGFFSSATFLSVLYYQHYWYLSALLATAYLLKAKAKSSIQL
jgi:putative inorganic carbon (hco3(-)) transporter